MFKVVLTIIMLWEGYKVFFPKAMVLAKTNLLLLAQSPVVDLTDREPGVVAVFPGQKVVKNGVVLKTMPFSMEMRVQFWVDTVYTIVLFAMLIVGPVPCKLASVAILGMSSLSKKLPPETWAIRLDSLLTIVVLAAAWLAI